MEVKTPVLCILLGIVASGCDRGPSTAAPPSTAAEACPAGAHFDPQSSGTISGRVTWVGDVPEVPPYRVLPIQSLSSELNRPAQRANPNAPAIDAEARGVGSAVVFLRGIEPQRGRPWDLPPVEVELKDLRIQVLQGGRSGPYGFVRRGAEVRMVSRQPLLHALHADGAAFFTLPFPEPNQPLSRQLGTPGVVELSSGVYYYWMRAYLFVSEHPYYCGTDMAGQFALASVPVGEYELVCWTPSWIEESRHRDTESFQPVRLYYRQPVEKVAKVQVKAGQKTAASFELSTGDFTKK
jgi:hypothetical protein